MPGEEKTIGDYTAAELAEMARDEFEAAQARGWKRSEEQPEPAPQPSPNVWAKKKAEGGVFTCPSGQTCRLRRVTPEQLLTEGILDQVSRLEGLAQTLVERAEGQPPAAAKMPNREEFQSLLDLIAVVVPLAVVEPPVFRDDDPTAPADAIRVSDIDLEDRMAIMDESLKGIKLLDRFRKAR